MRNNRNYKCIRLALELSEAEIVEICALGGLEIGKDKARRWGRSPEVGSRRFSVMTDADFDAFCSGLPIWFREQETENYRCTVIENEHLIRGST